MELHRQRRGLLHVLDECLDNSSNVPNVVLVIPISIRVEDLARPLPHVWQSTVKLRKYMPHQHLIDLQVLLLRLPDLVSKRPESVHQSFFVSPSGRCRSFLQRSLEIFFQYLELHFCKVQELIKEISGCFWLALGIDLLAL